MKCAGTERLDSLLRRLADEQIVEGRAAPDADECAWCLCPCPQTAQSRCTDLVEAFFPLLLWFDGAKPNTYYKHGIVDPKGHLSTAFCRA